MEFDRDLFLPVSLADMQRRGWEDYDFLLITGDAYVDHPSFGPTIIGRILEAEGYRVAILAQPDWRGPEAFRSLGRPRLGVLISAGNIDSMVAHYTAARKRRHDDAYSPGRKAGLRPDHATIVYSNRVREAFGDIPIIIGGLEASLRRFAHYDYWEDKVRRSILFDAQADILTYGMGETATLDIAARLNSGTPVGEITDVRGTCVAADYPGVCSYPRVEVPSFEEVSSSKRAYAQANMIEYQEHDAAVGKAIIQKHGRQFLIVNPPAAPLTTPEMDRVAECFANAALFGKRCGFDIINVHGAHDWLIQSFLSPISNQRTDQYGGNWENRARFPKMVLQRIRDKVGENTIIEMRFNACDYVKGGITIEDAAATIDYLSDVVDIIQCTGGSMDDPYADVFSISLGPMGHAINAWSAEEMKKRIKSNVIIETVGGINEPALAEQVLAEGKADLVAMARSFIADPDWARKAKANHAEDIRPCIRCRRCLTTSTPEFCNRSRCTVNPARTLPVKLPASDIPFEKKTVGVIGGGAAGMFCATELTKKGHDVILFEAKDKLGGVLEFTDHSDMKDDLKRYRDYLICQVKKDAHIDLRLNTTATPELLDSLGVDTVVLAAGGSPFIPPVPGADRPNVFHAVDAYGKEDQLGDHVVVVGGGFV